ncbi:hypothetical protein EG68_00204 [Paragonimus skrjabini miyazakii]|uniref:Uncharacterized protein n=1 Tax=Paragonimus skrjabini miyazakii TaxID=59628 RepID=A0A8S9Z9F4_9TREM|nr:hypothetical protein EG68_00204 [Paragonimus skrjabini miyazakii]
MPKINDRQLKPKNRKQTGKKHRKRIKTNNNLETTPNTTEIDDYPIYKLNPEGACQGYNPTQYRILTDRLLECVSRGDTPKTTQHSIFSPWTFDMINFSLLKPKKHYTASTNTKLRTDAKHNKNICKKQGKPSKFMTTFKHLDNVEDYITQYRKPKYPENITDSTRSTIARVVNINSNLKTNGNSNPATTRFKWLSGVSKNVHSRIISGNAKADISSDTKHTNNVPKARDGKHKSFESLLSYQDETSFDDHINGIGIIYTPGHRNHAVNRTDSCPDSRSLSKSVKNDLSSSTDQSNVACDSDEDESLWFVTGTSINKRTEYV